MLRSSLSSSFRSPLLLLRQAEPQPGLRRHGFTLCAKLSAKSVQAYLRGQARQFRPTTAPRACQAPSPSSVNADEGCEGVPTCPAGDCDDAATATQTQAGVPNAALLALDAVDLAEELMPGADTTDVPPFMRAAVRAALTTALQLLRDSFETTPTHDEAPASRAWKLFLLAPRMLVARTHLHAAPGRDEWLCRAGLPAGRVVVTAGRSKPIQPTSQSARWR